MEQLVQNTNVVDQVYLQLREAIIAGLLVPASLHSVVEFAKEFGVSRTPVREAVLRLADVGMVTIERNKGFRIRSASLEDIRNAFELRLLLEVPAASAAALRVNSELLDSLGETLEAMYSAACAGDYAASVRHHRAFHEAIDASLTNRKISDILTNIRDEIREYVEMSGSRHLLEVADRHVTLLDAIRASDPVAASRAMQTHVLVSATRTPFGYQVRSDWADDLLEIVSNTVNT